MTSSELVERGFVEGDFLQDGIITCGVCMQPREVAYDTPNGIVYFPIIHEHDLKHAGEQQRKDNLRDACFAGASKFATATLADLQAPKNVENEANTFAKSAKRGCDGGLLIFGENGVGKSYLAAAICNELIDAGKSCKFTSLRQIIQDTEGFGESTKVLEKLCSYYLVVLDDFATERNTTYGYERVFDIVDTFYRARQNLIVTTNLKRDQIAKSSDPRIMDRLKELCHCVEYKAENKRQMALKG